MLIEIIRRYFEGLFQPKKPIIEPDPKFFVEGAQFNETFCAGLTNERERLEISIADFADYCEISPATQFLYEKGDREPDLSYLWRIKCLGVDLHQLF